jgi:phosphotransferase system enzyme I (PtsI)
VATVLDGFGASDGIAAGKIFHLDWGVPIVPHVTIPASRIEAEIDRFHAAREWAKERLLELQRSTEERLGPVEARIFEPQILMLDDGEVVDGTVRYVRENHLSAERSFEWRMRELEGMWSRTSHPMVLDRLNDLQDLMVRVLHRLLGHHDPTELARLKEGVIIVSKDITPSLMMQLDTKAVLGIWSVSEK